MSKRILITLSFVAAAVIVGCESDQNAKMSINDHFTPDTQTRSMSTIFAQQQANGARADGTLYAHHFTGNELNSLGRQKLELMLAGPERGMVSIYLDTPKDNTYGPRESAVVAYVSGKGLSSEAYAITAGPNPNIGAPAVQGLQGLAKQQAAGDESGEGGDQAMSATPEQ